MGTIDRIPPQAIDIEKTILGSMIIDIKCTAIAIDLSKEDHYYHTAHRFIFAALKQMFSDNENIDLVLLSNKLFKNGVLDQTGGQIYLSELCDNICTEKTIRSYIDIIKDKYNRRIGIELMQSSINAMYCDEDMNGADICQTAVSGLLGVSMEQKTGIVRVGESLPDVFEYVESVGTGKRTPGDVKTGYPSIDQNVFLKKGFMHILAARPSMGKTAVVDCWCRNMARDGNVILKFNYESSPLNDATRNLFSESRVNLHDLNRGFLPKRELPKLSMHSNFLYQANIFIDSDSETTPARMNSSCLQVIHKAGKIDVVVVDHLQLVPPDISCPGNRNHEVGTISRQLMKLAERFNVVVIALSQLSRPAKGVVRPPVLSDLRESGEIEQNAEVVMFLHREEYYQLPKEVTDETRNKVDFIYAKQKNGPTGSKLMGYKKEWFLLEELDNTRSDNDYNEEDWRNK